MKTFRMVAGIFATFPLALLIDNLFFHPLFYCDNCMGTYIYMIVGVPILTMNFWAWSYPELIEFNFFGREPAAKPIQK